MIPKLNGIDHIHVYVSEWARAEKWYGDVLGFRRVKAFESWAVPGGPLTIESADGSVHLALFERENPDGYSVIAFGASADDFLAWKQHLESKGLKLRVTDHELAYSLYFSDPDNNMHEITTYEHDVVRARLAPD